MSVSTAAILHDPTDSEPPSPVSDPDAVVVDPLSSLKPPVVSTDREYTDTSPSVTSSFALNLIGSILPRIPVWVYVECIY